MFYFYTPWKYQKKPFLDVFFFGIEMQNLVNRLLKSSVIRKHGKKSVKNTSYPPDTHTHTHVCVSGGK